MALIKCPECGKEISNRANACPNCGCPVLLEEGLVAIKVPRAPQFPLANKTVEIINNQTNQVLWTGRQGQIARFYINNSIEVIIKCKCPAIKNITTTIHANKKYNCVQEDSLFGLHSVFNISEVDIIDSD